MTPWTGSPRFAADHRASSVVEFAIVGSIVISLCFAVIELGLLFWTRNALQSTAALTARCVAIRSPNCPDPRQFAVGTAGAWVFPGIISSADVTVQASNGCNGASGTYEVVTITCRFWSSGSLPPPFSSIPLTASACYPVDPASLS